MNTPVRHFDFHCHVDLLPDPAAMIAACERDHVCVIAVTTTPKAWDQNRTWTAGCRYVHAALGLHPELVGERHSEADLLVCLMTESPFIGEIGLDGSQQYRGKMQIQGEVFSRVLIVAQQLGGRVATIHSRRAAREVLACLAEHTTPHRVMPILHWFSDSAVLARQAVEQGCYFSVNRRMLSSKSGAALVRAMPAERILTETDAPFADWAEHQSGLNLAATVQQLAEVRGIHPDNMASILGANAERVLAFAGVS